jgi:hypothetical protein
MPARRSRRSSNKSGGLLIRRARSKSGRDAITPTMRERGRFVAELRAVIGILTTDYTDRTDKKTQA